jgi:hypothetical protein
MSTEACETIQCICFALIRLIYFHVLFCAEIRPYYSNVAVLILGRFLLHSSLLGLFGEQATDQIKCRIIIWAKLLWGLASTSMHITHPRRVTGRPLQFLYVTRMCISNLVLTIKIIMIIILVRKTTLELGSICPLVHQNLSFFAHDTKNVGFSRNQFMSTYNVKMYPSIFCSVFFNILNYV